ncbi:hypothetical protein [Streptomyces sp. ODS28]|uniref:hypothetical protein n=1 Tax=Streptomyces sp. ODS28 TaxID=3136688 RepID=UPI0031EA7699
MSFGQGGPQWGPGGSSTPDWEALAERTESRTRRRRWLLIGGGAVATALVAGIVAFAVVSEGGGTPSDKPSEALPSPKDIPSGPDQPEPTFKDDAPPPPPPEDFIKDAAHDKAPLSARSLFPDSKVTVNGNEYTRRAVDTSKGCKDAAHAKLGPVLAKHGCDKVFRTTLTRGSSAVTVGVAVFEDTGKATAAKKGYQPNLVALPGKGVSDFCRTVTCRTTADSLGRYAIFTISGHSNGKEAGPKDEAAIRAAYDANKYAYDRVLQRGKDQAGHAATASPAP